MWLIVDLGNTCIKMGIAYPQTQNLEHKQWVSPQFYRHGNDKLIALHRMPTEWISSNQCTVSMQHWLNSIQIEKSMIQGVFISSVVPSTESRLIQLLQSEFNWQSLLINASKMRVPFDMAHSTKREIGADILANLMAMYCLYAKPSIIFDYGSATTISVLSTHGDALGDVIIPGVDLSLAAFKTKIPHLPKVPFKHIPFSLGHHTDECIQLGSYWSTVFMTEMWVQWIEKSILHDSAKSVIATGGFAQEIYRGTSVLHDVDANLTFKGIWLLFSFNRMI